MNCVDAKVVCVGKHSITSKNDPHWHYVVCVSFLTGIYGARCPRPHHPSRPAAARSAGHGGETVLAKVPGHLRRRAAQLCAGGPGYCAAKYQDSGPVPLRASVDWANWASSARVVARNSKGEIPGYAHGKVVFVGRT